MTGMGKMDSYQPGSAVGELGDVGKEAERALLEALLTIPGMKARPATEEEDSGREEIVKDPAVDVIAYIGDIETLERIAESKQLEKLTYMTFDLFFWILLLFLLAIILIYYSRRIV